MAAARNPLNEVKTQFCTKEGCYKLLQLSDYSRPLRPSSGPPNSVPVRLSFVTVKDGTECEDKIAFNVGRDMFFCNFRGIKKQKEKELEDLKREKERRLELEAELKNERFNETQLEQSLEEEKRKLEDLEKTLVEERSKRQEIEKRLEEKQKNEDEVRSKLGEKRHQSETRNSLSLSQIKHRIPSYTPSIRSFPGSVLSDDINLLHHIIASGHILENCPPVKINKYSCRGYLSKMGRSRFHSSWTKRWFIFDRKLRALCYYHDERHTKAKGVIYFQAIQEVYVDNSAKKSPSPKTTFCVKTPQRNYLLAAPSPLAMSIWIDVLCTGKEGALC